MNKALAASLARNGMVVRAVLLAVATVVLLAVDRRPLIPVAVSGYAIANAYALTRAAMKAAKPRS